MTAAAIIIGRVSHCPVLLFTQPIQANFDKMNAVPVHEHRANVLVIELNCPG